MSKLLVVVGLSIAGLSAIASSAIAADEQTTARRMAELPLPALSAPLPPAPERPGQSLTQIFPPENFADVSPNHWAYTAVSTLAEDYGCLAGYPDGTFRGDEFVTRYEFAVALEACLDAVFQLIDPQQQIDTERLLNQLEVLHRELGTLADDVGELESPLETE
ncbi:S-layer homology domain-containing protein [Leptolyngbya iicbica]|uniref:S-layer homology domain-containing protein n=2 Tax=Cyanophyceae TaxID=3028117 RepID=A0A4Q7EAT8_9CYAN|nr:S-layer homology domain-containing protein [Leptolyngbya sp. LK]RZM79782.1 S-layer homology domain-containing protein [Leptolyngbya sp. LK]